ALHRAASRDHRLPDHLPAEHPLPARFRAVAAEQIHLERLDIEDGDEVDQAFGHGGAFNSVVIPGHRVAMNPESRADNLQIPGSRFARPGMTARKRPLFHRTVSPSSSLLARPRVSRDLGYVSTG